MSIALRGQQFFLLLALVVLTLIVLSFIILSAVAHIDVWHMLVSFALDPNLVYIGY